MIMYVCVFFLESTSSVLSYSEIRFKKHYFYIVYEFFQHVYTSVYTNHLMANVTYENCDKCYI